MGWLFNIKFQREIEEAVCVCVLEAECVSCVVRPTLRKLRAEDMFETWVSRAMDHTV